jgi:type II secretory pathway component PulL
MTNDPTDEEDAAWYAMQRQKVLNYLAEQGFVHLNIGEWPAWHVAPIVSVWAVESVKQPGWVGWWAISGDCPTDYVTCGGERNPRQALRDLGRRWLEGAEQWAAGERASDWGLRTENLEQELAPMLASRAQLLLDWAANDRNWEE